MPRPSGSGDSLGDDRTEYQQRALAGIGHADCKGQLPADLLGNRIGEIWHHALSVFTMYRHDHITAGITRDDDGIVTGAESEIGATRLPFSRRECILIFGEDNAPGVAEGPLVGLVRQETGDIA